jgi:addiction module RelE/StbE family toxin
MDFEIVWTEPASADLLEIFQFIAQDNPRAARRVLTSILDRVELLRKVPHIGTGYPRGTDGPYREIVSGKYRIFYKIQETSRRIEVLTVWHSARRDPRLPPT